MLLHACNSSSVSERSRVLDQFVLHGEFDASVYYIGIPISNNKTIYSNKGVTWPGELTQLLTS